MTVIEYGSRFCALATRSALPLTCLFILVSTFTMHLVPANAKPWEIEKTSSIVIQFSQFGNTEKGTFVNFTPKIEFDIDNPEDCRIDVKIDMSSIDTDNQQRDDIMKSSDFFEIRTYPHATFSAAKCKNIGGNAYEAFGDLTIRDITRPVMLPFTLDIEDKNSIVIANARAELPLSRFDYDLGTSTFWKSSGIVGRVIRIYLNIEAKVNR